MIGTARLSSVNSSSVPRSVIRQGRASRQFETVQIPGFINQPAGDRTMPGHLNRVKSTLHDSGRTVLSRIGDFKLESNPRVKSFDGGQGYGKHQLLRHQEPGNIPVP